MDGATGVCGSSAEGIGGCQFNRTWAQAEAVCVSSGARLCTQVELVPATAGRGCGHDDLLVWVWDECQHDAEGAGAYRVAVRGNDKDKYECSPNATLHAVRCCADQVSSLPPQLALLPKLQNLTIVGNPIRSIPQSVRQKGAWAVLD